MSLTPQITLTVKLYDYQGNVIGASSAPAYLRIALCGYGQTLPCIPGTGMVGGLGGDIPFVGSTLNVLLWGNDVITPAGTYYAISILDTQKNVVQSGIYQFTGTQTIDLSNAVQVVQPNPMSNPIQKIYYLQCIVPTTSVTLQSAPSFPSLTQVFWNGILQIPGVGYTISGSTVSLNFTAEPGDNIYVIYN